MPEASIPETIFIFVNPKSGGNAASVLLSDEWQSVKIDSIDVRIFAISAGEKGKKPGFLQLREVVETSAGMDRVKVIVAGGDGTVMWCLSEIAQHQIDPRAVVIGVLPFGTGNDFAKSLEWTLPKKFDPFRNNHEHLRELTATWRQGTVVAHDLWDIRITLRSDGHFLKVDSEDRLKHEMTDDSGNVKRQMDMPMCNYFSLGVESRIGVGFDKGRTTNATKNKMVYAKEGMKKSLFTSTLKVNDTVHSVRVGKDKSVAFTTKPGPYPLLEDSASLICVNIPSFASGMNLWGTTDKCGLVGQSKATGILAAPQMLGDKQLEWVTFASVAAIGFEATNAGHSKRVLRDEGPFHLSFHDTVHQEKIYFQVDGEFFVMVNPKEVLISHSNTINVLANPNSSKRDHYICV